MTAPTRTRDVDPLLLAIAGIPRDILNLIRELTRSVSAKDAAAELRQAVSDAVADRDRQLQAATLRQDMFIERATRAEVERDDLRRASLRQAAVPADLLKERAAQRARSERAIEVTTAECA